MKSQKRRIGARGQSARTFSNIFHLEPLEKRVLLAADLIIDNTDTAYVTKVGTWSASSYDPGYVGSDYLHDGNTSKGSKSVTFARTLSTAGDYDVYIRYPSATNKATNVPVDVLSGTTVLDTETVNQTQSGGTWVWLGQHHYNSGATAGVKIRTNGTNNYVNADAVRFVEDDGVAPSTPIGLRATPASDRSIDLLWQPAPSTELVTDYEVWRKAPWQSSFSLLTTLDATRLEYFDNALAQTSGGTADTGTFQYQVYAVSGGGSNAKSVAATASAARLSNNDQRPYGGTAWTVPGIIEAEDYDTGGQNKSYVDSGDSNQSGRYRDGGPDIDIFSAGGGLTPGYAVTYWQAIEWTEYTINVTQAGNYKFEAAIASAGNGLGGKFQVQVDGTTPSQLDEIQVPNTNYAFQTISREGFSLTAGQHVLKVRGYEAGIGNKVGLLGWFRLSQTDSPPAAPTGLAIATNSVTSTSVALHWLDNATTETGYKIDYSTDSSFPAGSTTTKTAAANATGYLVQDLAYSTTYYFRVRATNSSGDSANTSTVSATTTTPASPLTMDNTDSTGITTTGTWTSSTSDSGYQGTNYIHDGNGSKGNRSVRYTPSLPAAGTYQVYAKWTASNNRATNVPYDIVHAGGTTTVTKSQRSNGGQWNYLGTFTFNATGGYVLVRNTGTDGFVVADGMQFVPLSTPSTPNAPSALTGNAGTATISLQWTDNATDESGFELQYNTVNSFDGIEPQTLDPDTTSYVISGLTSNTPYYIRIRAIKTGATPSAYATFSVSTLPLPTVPAKPLNLTATSVSSERIDLAWVDVATDETNYQVQASTSGNFAAGLTINDTIQLGANASNYQLTGLSPSTTYYFRVRAINGNGPSDWSEMAEGKTRPQPPTGVAATATYADRIVLVWTDNSPDEIGFKIERRLATAGTWAPIETTGPGITSYQDNSVIPSTAYEYRVLAYNVGGDSIYSTPLASATTSVAVSGLQAVASSDNQINLLWTGNVVNHDHFSIERSASGTGGWTAITTTVSSLVTSYFDSGLASSTTYFYRVTALGASAVPIGAPSIVASATTDDSIPDAPSSLTANIVSSTRINLSWVDNASHEEGFVVDRATDNEFTQNVHTIEDIESNVTTYSDSGLTPETTYYYRVRAKNSAGDSPNSNTATKTTPASLTAAITGDASVNEGATYTLHLSVNGFGSNAIDHWIIDWDDDNYPNDQTVTGNPTTVTHVFDDGLVPANVMSITATAFASVEHADASPLPVTVYNVAPSASISQPPTNPIAGTAIQLTGSVTDPSSADSAEFFYTWSVTKDGVVFGLGGTDETFSFTPDTAGSYVVSLTATDKDNGASLPPAMMTVIALAPLAPPTSLYVESVSPTNVALKWTDVASDETGYRLYRRPSGATTWTQVGSNLAANASSVNDTSVQPNTAYEYQVRAINALGESDPSNIITVSTPQSIGISVSGSNVVAEGSEYTLSITVAGLGGANLDSLSVDWGEGSPEQLDVSVPSVSHVYLDGPTTRSLKVTGTKNGTSYESNTISVSVTNVAPVISVSGTGEVLEDTPYVLGLYAFDPGQDIIDLWTINWGDGKSDSLSSHTYENPNTYTITVSVHDEDKVGNYPAIAHTVKVGYTLPSAAPASLSTTSVTASGITLNWSNDCTNETGYKIEQAVDEGVFTRIATTLANATTFTVSNLVPGRTYSYRVRATNPAGDSDYSPTITRTALSAVPIRLKAIASATSVNVSWAASDGATGYKLQRSLDGFNWTASPILITTTSYSDTGLSEGTYYYRVAASNGQGDSAYALPVSAGIRPSSPTGLSATVANDKVTLSWTDNSVGEQGYRVERSRDGSNFAYIGGNGAGTGNGGTQNYVDTIKVSGTYYYRVSAYNLAGESSWTNIVSKSVSLPLPLPPSNLLLEPQIGGQSISVYFDPILDPSAGALVEFRGGGTNWHEVPKIFGGYSIYGLIPKTEYEVRVRTSSIVGESEFVTASATTLSSVPSVGTVNSYVQQDSVEFSWNWNYYTGFIGAGTKIERANGTVSPGDSGFTPLETLGRNVGNYVDYDLPMGTTYTYRFCYYSNEQGNGPWTYVTVTTRNGSVPDPITDLNVEYNTGGYWGIHLSFTDPSNGEPGTSFEFQYKAALGNHEGNFWDSGIPAFKSVWSTLGNVKTLHLEGLNLGTSYNVRVRAERNGIHSDWSNVVTFVPAAAANSSPQNLTIEPYPNDPTKAIARYTDPNPTPHNGVILWAVPTDLTIPPDAYAMNPNLFNQYLRRGSMIDGSSSVIEGLSPNTEYRFVANVSSGGGYNTPAYYSAQSNIVTYRTPNAKPDRGPSSVNIFAPVGNMVVLKWFNIDRATGCNIYRSTDSTNWTPIGSSQGESFTDSSVTPGSLYYYKITSTNSVGESSSGTITQISTPRVAAPVKRRSYQMWPTSIVMQWADMASDEDGYQIERQTDGLEFVPIATNVTADSTSYTDTPNTGASFTYRVRSFDGAYYSAWTYFDPVVLMKAPVPVAPTLSSNALMVNLSWTDLSDNEATFEIERSLNGNSGWATIGTVSADTRAYQDSAPAQGSTYYYRFRARSGDVVSPYSVTVSVSGTIVVPSVDIVAYGTGARFGQVASESDENDQGKYVITPNTDYEELNESGNVPLEPPSDGEDEIALIRQGTVVVDDDLARLVLPAIPLNVLGSVELKADSSSLRIFGVDGELLESEDLTLDLTNPHGYLASLLRGPLDVWVEALESDEPCKISFVYKDQNDVERARDDVKITVARADATYASEDSVDLTWTEVLDAESYKVYRRKKNENVSQFVLVATIASDENYCYDDTVVGGTEYVYEVRAITSTGSVVIPTASATTAPLAPVELRAVVTSSTVALQWKKNPAAVSNPDEYAIYRSSELDPSALQLIKTLPGSVLSFTDVGLTAGTTYYYQVQARFKGMESDRLETVMARVKAYTVPSAPAGLSLDVELGDAITVAWSDTSSNETRFRVERKSGGSAFETIAYVAADQPAFIDTNVARGQTYIYRVFAENSQGSSKASASESIVAPALAPMTAGPATPNGSGFPWPIPDVWTGPVQLDGMVGVASYDAPFRGFADMTYARQLVDEAGFGETIQVVPANDNTHGTFHLYRNTIFSGYSYLGSVSFRATDEIDVYQKFLDAKRWINNGQINSAASDASHVLDVTQEVAVALLPGPQDVVLGAVMAKVVEKVGAKGITMTWQAGKWVYKKGAQVLTGKAARPLEKMAREAAIEILLKEIGVTLKWNNHGNKHFWPKGAVLKDVLAETAKGKPARYLENIDVEVIELSVWRYGENVANGKPWKVFAFDQNVGVSAGKQVKWVRVEKTSGEVIHGHPITEQEYLRLLGN